MTPRHKRLVLAGTVLAGTYRLEVLLGEGLSGATYGAVHLRRKRRCAIKLLRRSLDCSGERARRFRADLRALGPLEAEGFLPVDLALSPERAPFLCAERLAGDEGRALRAAAESLARHALGGASGMPPWRSLIEVAVAHGEAAAAAVVAAAAERAEQLPDRERKRIEREATDGQPLISRSLSP